MTIRADFEPGERDMDRPIERARVVVEDEGWADDSVFGQRHVLYFTRDDAGRLRVERALRAMLCLRPGQRFYSADPCP
jgi:hypothetical protein